MKLLIVEDDLALSDVLRFTLRRAGFEVLLAHDGRQALAQWERENPELILLDLNLPKLDGLAVCRHIRAQSQTPIIMLSVRGGDEAVVQGLEMGADDYMVKPFSPTQLVARVRAVLRRTGNALTPGLLHAADLTLDRARAGSATAVGRACAPCPAGNAFVGSVDAQCGAGADGRKPHHHHLGRGRGRPHHAQAIGLSPAGKAGAESRPTSLYRDGAGGGVCLGGVRGESGLFKSQQI